MCHEKDTILIQVEAQASISYKWFDLAFKWIRRLFKPWSLFPVVHLQGRMAGASTSIYEFDSVVKGQYVYKKAQTQLTDKMHKCTLWDWENEFDKYTVNDWL